MPFVGSTKVMTVQRHHGFADAKAEVSDSGITLVSICISSSSELCSEKCVLEGDAFTVAHLSLEIKAEYECANFKKERLSSPKGHLLKCLVRVRVMFAGTRT